MKRKATNAAAGNSKRQNTKANKKLTNAARATQAIVRKYYATNSNGSLSFDPIPHSLIPVKHAVTVNARPYDRRWLYEYIKATPAATVPHTRRRLTPAEVQSIIRFTKREEVQRQVQAVIDSAVKGTSRTGMSLNLKRRLQLYGLSDATANQIMSKFSNSLCKKW